MQRISHRFEYLYFPIDWKSKEKLNSRALAYLIGREHDTVIRQLAATFHNAVELGTIHHTGIREFTVTALFMTKEQFVRYLEVYPNPYRETVRKQREKGILYKDVQIHNKRFIINDVIN